MISKRIQWLLAVALVLIALTWAVAHHTVEQERSENFRAKAKSAQQLAVFFERQTRSTLRYADAYLKMIRREYLQHRDLNTVRAVMDEIPLDHALVSHVTIINATGIPVFNSGYPIKPGTNTLDRDYFIYQKSASSDELHVSLPTRGRNSGRVVVRLVRRIESTDGQFDGVLFAALDATSVTDFFVAMNLGPKSSATLVGNDKRIRARSSYGRLGPGQDISESRLWRALEQASTGLYLQTSVVDQVTRHYAYRQLSEFPLVVAIGIANEDISNAVAGIHTPAYAIALLATVLILTMAALLTREMFTGAKLASSEAHIRNLHDELELRVEQRSAELEKVQQELLRKQRLAVLGQLTGTVAHELRNPLGTILTSVTAIERKLENSSIDLGASVARILRSIARCNTIISELLDFTRVTEIDLQAIEIDPWVAGTIEELAETATGSLRCELNALGVTVELDCERVRRALINLIDNACDAVANDDNPEHGSNLEVQVLTRCSADRVEIEVRDDGPGIPESLLVSVHEPLFSTKSFGVGLGLPVVGQVMEEHNGGFELISEPGRGTRAIIWFPRHRGAPDADTSGGGAA